MPAEKPEDVNAKLLRAVEALNETIGKAFPDGDVEGHRRYHEMVIEEMESRKRLRRAIIEKTLTGFLWVAILWIGTAMWNEVQGYVKQSQIINRGQP